MKNTLIILVSVCLFLVYLLSVAEYLIPIVYPLGKAIGLPICVFAVVLPLALIFGYALDKDSK